MAADLPLFAQDDGRDFGFDAMMVHSTATLQDSTRRRAPGPQPTPRRRRTWPKRELR